MIVQDTPLKDCFIIQPQVFKDDRGYFMESYNEKLFQEKLALPIQFVQDNETYSQYGVIRGLHAQEGAHAQSKLVRVILGEVLDVVVDMRADSPTFMQHFSIRLSAENKKQLWVPKGFFHGYAVLSEEAIFQYKCDAYYHSASEVGLRYDDPKFNIDWMIPEEKKIIAPRDKSWALL